MGRKTFALVVLFVLVVSTGWGQGYWHGQERTLRYHPEGEDFVIVNGDNRFNRALYGTNTAFRVETGDVPEFGFFMPHQGGNMQLGLMSDKGSLWLNDAEYIKSVYRPGTRIYEIKDPFLQNGLLRLTVLAMADAEGMVLKLESSDLPAGIRLICTYGGASGKRFYRNADLGVDDPEAFSLKSENCEGNRFTINGHRFELNYGEKTRDGKQIIRGVFPKEAQLKLASPDRVMTPRMVWTSEPESERPLLVSAIELASSSSHYLSLKKADGRSLSYADLPQLFEEAEAKRKEIAGTVWIYTPDPYINTLGGVISTAADGIWEPDCWLHGAIGWRMPLNGWRAAYVGDVIGWHERARKHFDGYAASQIKHVEPTIPHPSQDEELNLARARKEWGTQMYSNGYITRNQYDTTKMHHYDMNLVYIDQLLWHLNWTGDLEYARKVWPVITSHLKWEKRNFDLDNDGLYDAYAAIWASDALQYNSGAVTHTTAYNYRANRMAALIASRIGEDPTPYAKEAERILNALNARLWLDKKGWWAEFQDFMGHRIIHPNAGLWTVYHAIDSEVHTPFQAYQATRYIDTEIPHIPVLAKGLEDEGYYTLSTTNWLPYAWSINNVAFAEVGHTALAYWQAGRADEAFRLFKSAVLDGMYLGASPGNIGQVSFYDAARGECYRDFGDPIGVYSRALIQGLFGVYPDLLNGRLLFRPGFPTDWKHASIKTPDLSFSFNRSGLQDQYILETSFPKTVQPELTVRAVRERIKSIRVNGKPAKWTQKEGVGFPEIRIVCATDARNEIFIEWEGENLNTTSANLLVAEGQEFVYQSASEILRIFDPQTIIRSSRKRKHQLQGTAQGVKGHRTFFVLLRQGTMRWWQPVHLELRAPLTVVDYPEAKQLEFRLKNETNQSVCASVRLNDYRQEELLQPGKTGRLHQLAETASRFGSNRLTVYEGNQLLLDTVLVNWNLKNTSDKYRTVDLDHYFNDPVTKIFQNQYLTPRSPYTTLQIPVQGIGEWCHPKLMASINDEGLRSQVKEGCFLTPMGIPFRTPAETDKPNIVFTSLWDNYPTAVSIPLSGQASHAYLLMAGSSNHMQCHIPNGIVRIKYTDGSEESLRLINPETWVPIEQDFYVDGAAFRLNAPRMYRVGLKRGVVSRDLEKDLAIDPAEVYGRTIDGGAATILDIPLDPQKELKELYMETLANDVVVGLMAITLLN